MIQMEVSISYVTKSPDSAIARSVGRQSVYLNSFIAYVFPLVYTILGKMMVKSKENLEARFLIFNLFV